MEEAKKKESSDGDDFLFNCALALAVIGGIIYGLYIGIAWVVAQFLNQVSSFR